MRTVRDGNIILRWVITSPQYGQFLGSLDVLVKYPVFVLGEAEDLVQNREVGIDGPVEYPIQEEARAIGEIVFADSFIDLALSEELDQRLESAAVNSHQILVPHKHGDLIVSAHLGFSLYIEKWKMKKM
jgi:hypothetical protein